MSQEKNDFQKKYIEFQLIQENLKQIHQQINSVEGQLLELKNIQESLDSLGKVEKGKDLLVPLGSGIFSKANLKENKEVLMDIGDDVFVSKNIDDAKKLVEDQRLQLEGIKNKLQEDMSEFKVKLIDLQKE